jgi:hypothetical protein
VLAWSLPSQAEASDPIYQFNAVPSTSQAGGHPDLTVNLSFGEHREVEKPHGCDCADPKNIILDMPAGFIADPHATPQCTEVEFGSGTCPSDSQIGVAATGIGLTPVFNLEPPAEEAGLFGFLVPLVHIPIYQIVSPRTESDYGLKISILGLPLHHFFPLTEVHQRIWGVPADSSNDTMRFPRGELACSNNGPQATPEELVESTELGIYNCGFKNYTGSVPSTSAAVPYLDNPTSCGVPLSASVRLDSYDGGSETAEYPWPATTGCDQLTFNPSLFAQPTTTATDAPSGIDIDLRVPQQVAASVPSPSEIRAAVVTLPPGFTINPGAADGKTSCSNAEASFNTDAEAHCPDFSKVGSLSIESSALPGPLPGYIYLGQPEPGNRYRIFLVADGFGVHVKLPGSVIPDSGTGQISVSFEDPELPQTPFEDFNMHFFGSERGLLATPTECGVYPVSTKFTPWDSLLSTQTSTQFFGLGSGPEGGPCPGSSRPFAPVFSAGVEDSTSGQHTSFTLNLLRRDGDQNLRALSVSTPPGFLATLKGIPYCSNAALLRAASGYSGLQEQSSPSCPAASRIGASSVGAGAGTHPVFLPGEVYLAGPYRGAPLSLAVITPAVSGPYDLGSVVVRAALRIDPATLQITAVSDPLPLIVQGIPLRLRQVRIELNRAGFVLNPTNCEPFSVDASLGGDQGGKASLSYPFQVANCASLPFAPKLSLKLTGGVHRLGHPAIHALITTTPGEANARTISVTLPANELLDNAHIRTVCTKGDFANLSCPAGALLGHAEVTSPLLDEPLHGSAYLRSSGTGLPDLALDLDGQIHIEAVAHIDAVHGGLRTTFQSVPDVPLGSVALNLQGGPKGLIQNSESLCGTHTKKATTHMSAQNGAVLNGKVPLRVSCGKTAQHKRQGKSRADTQRGAHR